MARSQRSTIKPVAGPRRGRSPTKQIEFDVAAGAQKDSGADFAPRSIGKVRIKKIAEVVASQLRNAIVRGEIQTGATLPTELQLIETFGVSRPTIREAIRILESEHLIRICRGARGGALVLGVAPELPARVIGTTLQARHATLQDVYEARVVFEPAAARLAAVHAPPLGVQILRDHIERERALLGERPRLATAMAEFHRLLVEQSGNKTLVLIAEALHDIVKKHNSLVYRSVQSQDEDALKRRAVLGLKSHARLVDLIEAGDEAGAEDHWRRHMVNTREFWLGGSASATRLDVLE